MARWRIAFFLGDSVLNHANYINLYIYIRCFSGHFLDSLDSLPIPQHPLAHLHRSQDGGLIEFAIHQVHNRYPKRPINNCVHRKRPMFLMSRPITAVHF